MLDGADKTFAKICGITNAEDALMCLDAGADAIGVNLFEGSKRHVTVEDAAGWLDPLEGRVTRVAVVVDPTREALAAVKAAGVFDAVQFHGAESPGFCERAGFRQWIKAIRVRGPKSLEEALQYETPFLLLDSWVDGQAGGTGVRVDWDLARDFVEENPDRRVILAGGLNPSNLREALRIVRPFGADVASGVELSPRAKEEYLVREFIRIARGIRPR